MKKKLMNTKGKTECAYCSLKPGGVIMVDNVKKPVCPKCGKKLVA